LKKATFITTALFSLLLLACDSWLGVNITQEGQLEKMQLKIMQFLKPDVFVHEIKMTSADKRAKDIMGSVFITYTDVSDSNRLKEMTINICDWKLIREKELKTEGRETFLKKKYGTEKDYVRIADYNLTIIVSVCKQAIKQVEAQDMKHAGIEYFVIRYRGEQPEYEFMLNGRPNGSGVTSKGRYSAIYYYEILFQTTQNGNLDMSVGDKLKIKRGDI